MGSFCCVFLVWSFPLWGGGKGGRTPNTMSNGTPAKNDKFMGAIFLRRSFPQQVFPRGPDGPYLLVKVFGVPMLGCFFFGVVFLVFSFSSRT